eukprot:Blabericola_migrator_1__12374@NODE_776_length_6565_cov_52_387504_g552_i0_p4_GENE_NODE_776_length_6565_cov_52_387504_g552_i0NODE_776_length_6565_cov_52_387504_g552_i0_p4_ORF_typecomplete_len117_score3_66_NODE_776_length_6565_cov_52_387504_g552_i034083758
MILNCSSRCYRQNKFHINFQESLFSIKLKDSTIEFENISPWCWVSATTLSSQWVERPSYPKNLSELPFAMQVLFLISRFPGFLDSGPLDCLCHSLAVCRVNSFDISSNTHQGSQKG